MSAHDFWPARGFVKDAIKEEEQKSGTSISLDWSGSFGTPFAFQTGASNIVLLGSGNRVKLARTGVVPRPVREAILQELKR